MANIRKIPKNYDFYTNGGLDVKDIFPNKYFRKLMRDLRDDDVPFGVDPGCFDVLRYVVTNSLFFFIKDLITSYPSNLIHRRDVAEVGINIVLPQSDIARNRAKPVSAAQYKRYIEIANIIQIHMLGDGNQKITEAALYALITLIEGYLLEIILLAVKIGRHGGRFDINLSDIVGAVESQGVKLHFSQTYEPIQYFPAWV